MKKIIKVLLIGCILIFWSKVQAQTVTDTKDLDPVDYGVVAITDSNQTTTYNSDLSSIGRIKPYYIQDDESYAIYRSYFVFDLSSLESIPGLELTTVKVHYNTSGGLNKFKIVKPSSVSGTEQTKWTNIGNGSVMESDINYGQGNRTSTVIRYQLEQALTSNDDEIIFGVLSQNEAGDNTYADINDFWLEVIYEREAEAINATVRNDYHGFDGGSIGVGVNTSATSFNSPTPITGYEDDALNLAAYDNQTINGTLTVFNTSEAPLNKSEWEWRKAGQDPDPFYTGNQTPSHTLVSDDDGATFAAMMRGKYNISRTDYAPEISTNINSGSGTVIEGNEFSAPSTLTYSSRNYTFYEWSDGGTDNPRIIINPSAQTAKYKGSQISNNGSTFKANQRKVVRTDNGWEHMVYESMGHIWYEAKPPSGSWEFVPRDNTTGSPKYIDSGSNAKSPSIDYSIAAANSVNGGDNVIVVAWQEGSMIKIARYYRPGGTGSAYKKYGTTLSHSSGQSSSYALQPTVAWTSEEYFGIFYRTSSGVKYKFYKFDGIGGKDIEGIFPGTSRAESFAVDVSHDGDGTDFFAIAFEKPIYIPSVPKQIRMNYISFDHYYDTTVTTFSSSFLISSGSYPYNRTPSVAVTDDEISVGWVSTTSSSWSPASTKATVAHITFPGGSFNVSRSVFSNYVRSVSLAKLDDNSEYYVAWNSIQYTTPYLPPQYIHFNYTAKGSALSTIKGLNTHGWDLQLYDAPSDNDIQAVAFTPRYTSTAFTTPYSWVRSNSLGSYLKARPLKTSSGRGVSLSDSAGAVSFAINDLMVDGQLVKFVPIETEKGTIRMQKDQPRALSFRQPLSDVQPFLKSEPFSLTGSSELSFREWIGFSDSLAVLKRLGKNGRITFKAELVEAGTGRPVAILREQTLSGKSGISSTRQAWKVGAKDLKEGTVQLVLTVTTNLNDLQAVAEDYFEDVEMQAKMNPDRQKAYKELQVEPAEEITEYGLGQNYPNPFNPTTVISYQLPENTMVRLEVFDLLGRSVATLVNERQNTGKYEVTFDASHLASGMYLYRITAGEFTQSKKLFLIK